MGLFSRKPLDSSIFRFLLEEVVAGLPQKLADRRGQLLVESSLYAGSVAAEAALNTLGPLKPFLGTWGKMPVEHRAQRLFLVWELFTFIALFRWAEAEGMSEDYTLRWASFIFDHLNGPDAQEKRGQLAFYVLLREQMATGSQMGVNDLAVLWIRAVPGGDRAVQPTMQALWPQMRNHSHFPTRDAVDALALGIPSVHPLESIALSVILSQADNVMREHLRSETPT